MNPPTVKIRTVADMATLAMFVLVIWLPTGDNLFDLDGAPEPVEKRRLAEMPGFEWHGKAIAEYPGKYEAYFNDHFGYRKRLIRWHNRAAVNLLGVPSVPDVVMGEGGWLFYWDRPLRRYYFATDLFDSEELARWRRVLQERHDWLAARGMRYLVVFPPIKHTIYPEYNKQHKPIGDRSRLDQLMEYMKAAPDVQMLDLRGEMLAAKERAEKLRGERHGRLYQLTDTHWNDLGAFVAYRAIMNRLSEWFPELRPMPESAFERRVASRPGGDLARLLGRQDDMREESVSLRPRFPRRSREVDAGGFLLGREWTKGTEPVVSECAGGGAQAPTRRAVMFRDSYAEALIPFMSEHFRRIAYVWYYRPGGDRPLLPSAFDAAVIESERPHVVIHEIAERWLIDPPPRNPEGVAGYVPAGEARGE